MLKKNIALKKFEAINKTFLQNKDIGVLMDCSESKATHYRRKFLKEYDTEKDFFTPMIPTTDFVEFYKIDLERIRDNFITIHQLLREVEVSAKL